MMKRTAIALTVTLATVAAALSGQSTSRPPDTEFEGTTHPPKVEAARTYIAAFCAGKGEQCVPTETAALAELNDRPMYGIPRVKVMRNDCAKKSPDSYAQRNACERAEIKAYWGPYPLLLHVPGTPRVYAAAGAGTTAASSSGGASVGIRDDIDGSSTASATIRAKCTKDFPDDFSTRKYCMDMQQKAVGTLQARRMTSADERTIRTKCARDFPDDFSTRNYCEEMQLKALAAIR